MAVQQSACVPVQPRIPELVAVASGVGRALHRHEPEKLLSSARGHHGHICESSWAGTKSSCAWNRSKEQNRPWAMPMPDTRYTVGELSVRPPPVFRSSLMLMPVPLPKPPGGGRGRARGLLVGRWLLASWVGQILGAGLLARVLTFLVLVGWLASQTP